MHITLQIRRWSRTSWAIAFINVATILSGAAQESEIPSSKRIDTPDATVEWQLGLGGVVYGSDRHQMSYTNQVVFKVTNHRDSTLQANAALILRGEHLNRTPEALRILRNFEMEVGPGTTKRFAFALPGSVTFGWRWNSPGFTVQAGSGMDAKLTDASSGRVLWQRSNSYRVIEMTDSSVLRVLAIGPSARIPRPGGAGSGATAGSGSGAVANAVVPGTQSVFLAKGDRTVSLAASDPWQVPDHFACLAPMNAVVVSPDTLPTELTRGQLRSLAEYVANSGILILPDETAADWRAQLLEASPLPFELSTTSEGNIWFYGNGKIAGVAMPAVGKSDRDLELRLYELIDSHPEPPLANKVVYQRYEHNNLGPNAWKSAALVAGFLGLYALLCGPFLYFFRKLHRAQLIRSIGVIIAIFCIGSCALGVYLRKIPGDVEWATLTEACNGGGGIQHGRFHFVSAGNRNQNFGVTPDDTLLSISGLRNHYYGDQNGRVVYPEVIQPDEGQFRGATKIPIVPWGHAYWNSRHYLGDVQQLAANLKLPEKLVDPSEIIVTNPNSFAITKAIIYLQVGSTNPTTGQTEFRTAWVRLGSLLPGQSREVVSPLRQTKGRVYPNLPLFPTLPSQPLLGQVTAYVVGGLAHSPGTKILEGTGFESHSDAHAFVQRIYAEDLPPYDELVELMWSDNLQPKKRRRRASRRQQQPQIQIQ